MPKKKISQITIPTLLGILFLIFGVVAGVLMVQNQQIFRSRADETAGPKNVTVSNITDSSFVVSWTTDENSDGMLAWGETENDLKNLTESSFDSRIHHIEISGLEPKTPYYYQIFSDGKLNDDTAPNKTATAQQLPSPTQSNIISGSILNPDGTTSDNVLVYLKIDGGSTRSTVTSESGRWVIPLSEVRNTNLSSYLNIDESSVISVEATNGQADASASMKPSLAKPAPDITLGENYDFLDEPSQNEDFKNPESSLNIDSEEKKLNETNEVNNGELLNKNEAGEAETIEVTIDSVEDDEVVEDVLPEFYGTGTPSLEITITIESEPLSETVTIDEDGFWNWLPPLELEEGVHTITVTYFDEDGVLQTIKKQFEVQAAGDGSDLSPTNTPTPTLIPTATPSPTSTLTPTPTSVSPVKTDVELPDSGVVENSLVLAGVFVVALAGTLLILLV
ncbi:fibronectin type III domain-containing protein [Patescibacteria group bacterium]